MKDMEPGTYNLAVWNYKSDKGHYIWTLKSFAAKEAVTLTERINPYRERVEYVPEKVVVER
jgi:hypothetical protein